MQLRWKIILAQQQGLGRRHIAESLGITRSAVDRHLRAVFGLASARSIRGVMRSRPYDPAILDNMGPDQIAAVV